MVDVLASIFGYIGQCFGDGSNADSADILDFLIVIIK